MGHNSNPTAGFWSKLDGAGPSGRRHAAVSQQAASERASSWEEVSQRKSEPQPIRRQQTVNQQTVVSCLKKIWFMALQPDQNLSGSELQGPVSPWFWSTESGTNEEQGFHRKPQARVLLPQQQWFRHTTTSPLICCVKVCVWGIINKTGTESRHTSDNLLYLHTCIISVPLLLLHKIFLEMKLDLETTVTPVQPAVSSRPPPDTRGLAREVLV